MKIKDREHLIVSLNKEIEKKGLNCSLNHLDVSGVSNFSMVFRNSEFNGDISEWDVSRARTMEAMFSGSCFDGDLSKWDVSHVEDMGWMFNGSEFRGRGLENWNTKHVKQMSSMFMGTELSADLSGWNVERVQDMSWMFGKSTFNGDISNWRIPRIKESIKGCANMFFCASFTGDLRPLDLSEGHLMAMFSSDLEKYKESRRRTEELEALRSKFLDTNKHRKIKVL